MTKVVKFCNPECGEEHKELKPIELVKYIGATSVEQESYEASDFDVVSLVSKAGDNSSRLDLIAAWDIGDFKHFYWGYWNDGVVK